MNKSRGKTTPKTNTSSRYVTITSDETNTNNYRTLNYDDQPSHNNLKITVSNREDQLDGQFQGHTNQNPHQSTKHDQPISPSNIQQENQNTPEKQPSGISLMNNFLFYNVTFYSNSNTP